MSKNLVQCLMHLVRNEPALFKVGVKAVSTDTLVAVNSFNFLEVDLFSRLDPAIPAIVPQNALVGVDQQHEGRVQHREDQVERETDKEELSDFQPFEMKETFTERMLEQMIVTRLDEGHEHRALALALVWYQHFVIQLELTVHVVDVVLRQRDGLVQHVLKLGEHTRDLADNHGESCGAAIGPHGDISPVTEQEVGAVSVLIKRCDVQRSVSKFVLMIYIGSGIQQHLHALIGPG